MNEEASHNQWTPERQDAFGARIRAARNAKGLSQEVVGERMGVKKATVSTWEKGTRTLKHHDLAALCTLLSISADELLFGLKRWPFEGVQFESVAQLESSEIDKLEGALVSTAERYGFEIKLVQRNKRDVELKQANGGSK